MDLSNNPFELEYIQQMIVNVTNCKISTRYIHMIPIFTYEEFLRNSEYLVSVSPSNGINGDWSIVIFDKTTKRLVGEYYGNNTSLDVSKMLYDLCGTINCKILISRNSTGASVIAKLKETEVGNCVIYKERDMTKEEQIQHNPYASGIFKDKIRYYGYYETNTVWDYMKEALPRIIAVDCREDANPYIISPFILKDIMDLTYSKTGKLNLSNRLRAFIAGLLYIEDGELKW